MSADFLRWIAGEVGFPLVEGTDARVTRVNDATRALLGADPEGSDVVQCLAKLVGVKRTDPDLRALVARARTDGSATGSAGLHGQWKLFVEAPKRGRLRAVAAPAQVLRAVQLERRAAAADVAAGVSHEVANALSAIVGWAQLGQQQRGAQAADTFALIEDSARAARSAARRLLDAVRAPQDASPQMVDVGDLIADVTRLLRPEARTRNVTIECRAPSGAHVQGTSSALFTVVWNLVHNAMEALDRGGRINVASSTRGDTVRIVVADNGPGMDEAQRARAFDPYFTTKATGTGLGLAMVKEAVAELGGRIVLQTARGQGARFVVELPLAAEGAKARPAPPPSRTAAPDVRRRSGVRGRAEGEPPRVLIVEDDRALREMMLTTLELRQARVTAVGSAAEALALDDAYDVALVDFSLADERGDRLVAELRRRGVVGPAAVVTGMAEPPGLDPKGKPDLWLRKPFEPEDLLEIVRLLHTFAGQDRAEASDPAAD